jgi:hypothetical protein
MGSRETAAVRYRFKIDHARQVERVLPWLGWTVAVLATMGLVGFVGLVDGRSAHRRAGLWCLPRHDHRLDPVGGDRLR